MSLTPEQQERITQQMHIGDGVYAQFDGYGINLRVNDHRSKVAVYLEPEVLRTLVKFHKKQLDLATEFHVMNATEQVKKDQS